MQRFGDPKGPCGHVVVRDPEFWSQLAFGGSLGGAESWMDGGWESPDLTAVIRVLARNESALSSLDGGWALLGEPVRRWIHRRRDNTRSGSRRNIAAHYDLGNDFFSLFLDPSMTYSSAVFEEPSQDLESAQRAKYERLCERLGLREHHHVLEIGTGWGGFALHAAGTRGCRVTTTTISAEQHALAAERIREAGLEGRVELLFQDYRDLEGTYDRVVSIEMIEAVGHAHLDEYFRVCSDRLADGGSMAIQAILHLDQDFEASKRNVDFIKRYIFPGGQLPSVGAMSDAIRRGTDLRLTHLEDLTGHYAETLRRWRRRWERNLEDIRKLGADERFLRMWEFYLAYCEGGFEERVIGLGQLVFEKPLSRLGGPLPIFAVPSVNEGSR